MGAKRLAIGLDVDGVVANFSGKFVGIANRKFNLNLTPETQTDWHYEYNNVALGKERSDAVWAEINSTPNWWGDLDPMPSTNMLDDIEEDFKLYFITKRSEVKCGFPIENQTAWWLKRYFYLSYPTVIVTNRKGDIANALELDYFLDDKISNCENAIMKSPNTKVYLHDQPYNRYNVTIPRVSHVNQFFQLIQGGLYGIAA